jgi:hypothetical protein
MSVTIYYGDLPVPKGWRLWNDKSRPDPGRWFYEVRFHHTGTFKLGLDFRPMDGAFPDFWMPPLMWCHAVELDAVAKVLANPVEDWCKPLLNVHPSNAGALKLHIADYAQVWKKKKKLLFGAAEGAGKFEPEAQIDGSLALGDFEWNKEWTSEDVAKCLMTGMIAKAAKSVLATGGVVGQPAHETVTMDFTFQYVAKKPLIWQQLAYGAGDVIADNDGTSLKVMGDEWVLAKPMKLLSKPEMVMPIEGKPFSYPKTIFDTMEEYDFADRFRVKIIGMLCSSVSKDGQYAYWGISVELQRHTDIVGQFTMDDVAILWQGPEHCPAIKLHAIKYKPHGHGMTYECVFWIEGKELSWSFFSDKPVAGVNGLLTGTVLNPL